MIRRWLVLLMLALVHGCNGLRVVVDDYVHSAGWRMVTQVSVYVVTVLFLIAGSLAILTFNPGLGS